MAAAGKFMTFKHHGLSPHRSRGVSFNKSEAPTMQGARRAIPKHGYWPAVHGMSTSKLALGDLASTAGGITQANRRFHLPRTFRMKGSWLTPGGLFLAFSSALGGRTI